MHNVGIAFSWRTFLGRDWDEGVEPLLVRELVLASRELLPEYPDLVGHEWEPAPGRTSGGRGDLLFMDGQGAYAVVERKSILGSGSNTSRRKGSNSPSRKVARSSRLATRPSRAPEGLRVPRPAP